MNISRRNFIAGAGAAFASSALTGCGSLSVADGILVDQNLTVFLSDIHIEGGLAEAHHQNALFVETVEEVLKLRPRPARAVVFGDVARFFGKREDYAAAKPLLAKLEAAMPVALATGNHDHRIPMSRAFPQRWAASPVPGRLVTVVDLGTMDLLLLDSLHETKPEGEWNAGDGEIGKAQLDWLKRESSARKRPFFVGSHHNPREINDLGNEALVHLTGIENFAGWIHGHDHFWRRDVGLRGWDDSPLNRRPYRIVSLPSTGYWGDIGFVTVRTSGHGAELTNVERDFFFLNPLKPGERRPQEWDRLVEENNGDTVRIDW